MRGPLQVKYTHQMDELATLRSENILFKTQVTAMRTEIDELKTEMAALKVDVNYWNERYVNARAPPCSRSQCKAARTLAIIPEEIIAEAEQNEEKAAREWKARAYTLHDLFTADGWELMLEGAEKEGRQSAYWQGIYVDGCEVLRRMGKAIPST